MYTIIRNCAKFYGPKSTFQGCSGISIFHKNEQNQGFSSKDKSGHNLLVFAGNEKIRPLFPFNFKSWIKESGLIYVMFMLKNILDNLFFL